mmetsp:Transcript_82372/g.142870  ORF Transcript_82372/g.142870 Transcript_82372/m.142870 type:complete len:452 (+) Transcript_82372:111-1466(+)
MRTLAVVFMMLLPVADMIRDVQSSQCQASDDGTGMSASAHGALQFEVAASDAATANVAVSAPSAPKKQQKECRVLIDQGYESFTAYAVDSQKKAQSEVSHNILLIDSEVAGKGGNKDGGGNGDIMTRLTDLYASSYAKLLGKSAVKRACDTFISLKVYQTGTERAKALQPENEQITDSWKDQMNVKMQSEFGGIEEVSFKFLTTRDEVFNESADAFRDEKFNKVAEKLKLANQLTGLTKNAVIGLNIGAGSTHAFTYQGTTPHVCVGAASNELLGTKPMSNKLPGVRYEEVKEAFLTLLKGAAGVPHNKHKGYQVVLAFNSIQSTTEFVLNFLLKCECEMQSDLGGKCAKPPDDNNCQATKDVKELFQKQGIIEPQTFVNLAGFADGTYMPSAEEQAQEGSDPAKFLLGLAQAIVEFGVGHVIIDNGSMGWNGRWVSHLISPTGVGKCASR